jgi:hypothetical protein
MPPKKIETTALELALKSIKHYEEKIEELKGLELELEREKQRNLELTKRLDEAIATTLELQKQLYSLQMPETESSSSLPSQNIPDIPKNNSPFNLRWRRGTIS